MLAFFRKYEKTFLLVIFAPALIGMGITGAIISVIQDPGEQVRGQLFGEDVSEKEFQSYQRLSRSNDADGIWRLLALSHAAKRYGLDVSKQEVGNYIIADMKFPLAQRRVMKKLDELQLDQNDPAQQREFSRIFQEELENDTFDEVLYREILEERGVTEAEWEDIQAEEKLRLKLQSALQSFGYVTPEQVWEAFQEQRHLRTLELIEIAGAAHAPDATVTDPAAVAYVSTEQVTKFYERHRLDYAEERLVDVQYIRYGLRDAELFDILPADEDAVYDYYVEHYVASGVAPVGSFDRHRDDCLEVLNRQAALTLVDEVMHAIAAEVAEVTSQGQTADLQAVYQAVRERTRTPGGLPPRLEIGRTGLVSGQAIRDHEDIGGLAAGRWFEPGVGEIDDVSDVLGSREAYFVLQTKQIRPYREPTFTELAAQVREDYARGATSELEEYYAEYKNSKYRQPLRFKVEALSALTADYADADAAKAALERALEVAREKSQRNRDFNLSLLQVETSVPNSAALELETVEVSRADMTDHPVLGEVAADVPVYVPFELPNQVFARPDGTGFMFFRVRQQLPGQPKLFEDVIEDVRTDVLARRGRERARVWAEETLGELRGKTGKVLSETLARLGLEARETEAFARDATSLEGIEQATDLITAAFSEAGVVDGPFFKIVEDPAQERVFLIRVASRQDAEGLEAEYAEEYFTLREETLRTQRQEFYQAATKDILLEAKGISAEHVDYARTLRDGPGGESRIRLRQIFLPADAATIDAWIREAALTRLGEVQAALQRGDSWAMVVDQYSEDQATRDIRGEMAPVQQTRELVDTYGLDFDVAVWQLRPGEISDPIESTRGFHLVKMVERKTDGKAVFAHVMLLKDAEARGLPESVRTEAETISRQALEAALARLEDGEPFIRVAREVGDETDAFARGQLIDMGYVTAFEAAALSQPLDWAVPADRLDDLTWMPDPVQLTDPDGTQRWHWFAATRPRSDRSGKGSRREVHHIVAASETALGDARDAMADFMEDFVDDDGDRPSFGQILTEFRTQAREASSAPDASKGGAVGVMGLDIFEEAMREAVTGYGPSYLQTLAGIREAGQRLGVFRSEAGYHIVEVLELVTPTEDEAEAASMRLKDDLLQGTEWR